jgi:hypothetical protein
MSDKHYTHHDDQTHLETALRQARPWLETNATFLIYGLAAILAVTAAVIWTQRQPVANAAASALFQEAAEPEDFQAIADDYGETKLGQLARLNQATGLLNSASRNFFTDRDAADADLKQAQAALERLAETGDLDAMMQERVLIGQARLAEIRCDGTDESVQATVSAWQAVLDECDPSMAQVLAEGQIKALKDSDNASFYAWLSALEPTPADDLNMPGLMPGMGVSGPGSTVPDIPEGLTMPVLPESLDETPEGDQSGDEDAEEPVSSDKPAGAADESADEGPVPEDKPAASEESSAPEEPVLEGSPTDGESTDEESTDGESTDEE